MTRLKIFPVIHVLDEQQSLANAAIAHDCGADGVFLIHMDGRDGMLDPIGRSIRRAFPDLLLGVNYLSMSALEGLERSLAQGWDASWCDNPGVRSDSITSEAIVISETLTKHPRHMYFGSVAFKYQPVDPDPAQAAVQALALGMIPTTSGEATGLAPTMDKLTKMRQALGSGSLAVASGISPENVPQLGPMLTHALVATGICRDFHHFCPNRLDLLIQGAGIHA